MEMSARPVSDLTMLWTTTMVMTARCPDPEKVCRAGHAEARRAADHVEVQDDDAYDLGEAERDDGEVVAAQPKRRDADQKPHQARDDRADEDGDGEDDDVAERAPAEQLLQILPVVDGEVGRRVRADCHEARVPDGELPRKAVDEVQGDGEDDVDADQHQHLRLVRAEPEPEQPLAAHRRADGVEHDEERGRACELFSETRHKLIG